MKADLWYPPAGFLFALGVALSANYGHWKGVAICGAGLVLYSVLAILSAIRETAKPERAP
jgi:hypothetical protein